MAESLFIFKLVDDGGAGPRAVPGSADRGQRPRPGSRPTEPRPVDSANPRRTPSGQPGGQAPDFGQGILDAIERIGRYSILAGIAGGSDRLFGPFVEIGRILQELRGGREGEAGRSRPGSADRSQQSGPAPQAPPVNPNFTLQDAVFHAEGARIVFLGGNVQPPGQAPPGPTPRPEPFRPEPGGPRPGRPRRAPTASPEAGLPATIPGGLPSVRPTGVPSLSVSDQLPGLNRTRVVLEGITTNAAAAGSGMAEAGAAAAAGAVSLLGLITAVGGATVVAGALTAALHGLYQRANEQSQRLAGYDGMLAAAQARAQVARVQQDVQSSQYLRRELSRLVEVQTRGSVATQKILDILEKQLLKILLPILEAIVPILETLSDNQEKTGKAVSWMADGALSAIPVVGPILVALKRWLETEEGDVSEIVSQFESLFKQIPDLEVDDPTGVVGNPGGKRPGVNAGGWGPVGMP